MPTPPHPPPPRFTTLGVPGSKLRARSQRDTQGLGPSRFRRSPTGTSRRRRHRNARTAGDRCGRPTMSGRRSSAAQSAAIRLRADQPHKESRSCRWLRWTTLVVLGANRPRRHKSERGTASRLPAARPGDLRSPAPLGDSTESMFKRNMDVKGLRHDRKGPWRRARPLTKVSATPPGGVILMDDRQAWVTK